MLLLLPASVPRGSRIVIRDHRSLYPVNPAPGIACSG